MTANSTVSQSIAVADPEIPENVIKPNADGSINVSGSISAVSAATATAAAPSYSEGISEPLSQDLSGALRVLTTFPATVAVTQSGTWTVGISAAQTIAVTNAGTFVVQAAQATAASLNATVVGTGTFAVQAAQSGTWTVQPGNTANTTPWLVTSSHAKTIKTAPISAITADTDVIAAVTSKRIKVIAYALFTTGTTASTLAFKSNGTGGTLLANVMLQSQASAIFGANLAVPAPSFLFATAAGEKLTLDVGNTDPITGFLTYFDDDAT